MPLIHVNILEGRTPSVKAQLIHAITDSAVRILEVQPTSVRVILHDIPPENWGIGFQSKAVES